MSNDNEHVIYLTSGCIHSNMQAWQYISIRYFQGNPYYCEFCKTTFDIDGITKFFKTKSFMMQGGFQLFNVNSATKAVFMQPDTPLSLPTSDFGIPNGAKIIDIACCANSDGNLKAVYIPPEPLNHRFSPKSLELYPIKTSDECHETKICISVVWTESIEEDLLIHAYQCYIEDKARFSILPLNTFIEAKVKEFLTSLFEGTLLLETKERRKNYLDIINIDKQDYFSCLKILLPIVISRYCIGINMSILLDVIDLLNKLRNARNKHAHGKPTEEKANDLPKWFASIILIRNLLDALLKTEGEKLGSKDKTPTANPNYDS